MIKKRGYFFSLDALIAVVIIIVVISIVPTFYLKKQPIAQQVYFSNDILELLSTLKVGEINDEHILSVISDNSDSAKNRTMIEQIVRLQVGGYSDEAEELTRLLVSNLTPDYFGIGIWAEDYDEAVYSTSEMPANQLISAKQLVSGIERDKAIEGLSSRVFLTGINERVDSSYIYFGGYIGDGNITKKIILPSEIENISSAYMELDAGSDFDLYINNISSGSYNVTEGNLTADYWDIDAVYLDNFNVGENTIKLDFTDDESNESNIGGGYFRVNYVGSEFDLYTDTGEETFYLPGIEGIINIYDSFYIPGTLDSMNIYLNYYSNYSLFLTIGNTTIFNQTEIGAKTISLSNSQLSSLLDYSSFDKKTTPFRLGLTKSPEGEGGTSRADIILITDLSGSMNYRLDSDVNGVSRDCSDPDLYDSSTKRISLAKCLDKDFIDTVLANPANRVALSGFYGDAGPPNKGKVYEEGLTNDAEYLKQKIEEDYSPQGGTCICCSINDAYKILEEESDESRKKYVIVMSDGIPTHACGSANKCDGTRTGLPGKEALWLGWGSGCYGGSDDCDVNDCECASENAEWSSCRVRNQFNATVHSIGFGPVATCNMANKTLRDVAQCGGGDYFASNNATVLEQFYQNISEEILSIGYEGQIAIPLEEYTTTILYPNSYIQFEYTPILPPSEYGRIPITIEGPRFNNPVTSGILNVPSGTVIYEAKLTSYSGEKWTDKAAINNSVYELYFYNLSQYGTDYFILGDPYVVDIPVDYIRTGDNKVSISTGLSSANSTGGSPDDRAIYTLGITIYSNYTGVYERAEGCIWQLDFEDGTNATVRVPSDYSGTDICQFTSSTVCETDYSNDATNNAACNLFKQLDFDNDGELFVKIDGSSIQTEIVSLGKIPYMWGPTLMEVRVWN